MKLRMLIIVMNFPKGKGVRAEKLKDYGAGAQSAAAAAGVNAKAPSCEGAFRAGVCKGEMN
jgi:hypothetical protein